MYTPHSATQAPLIPFDVWFLGTWRLAHCINVVQIMRYGLSRLSDQGRMVAMSGIADQTILANVPL